MARRWQPFVECQDFISLWCLPFDARSSPARSYHKDCPQSNAEFLLVTGNAVGLDSINQLVFLDGINDGPGGADDFESVELNEDWNTTPVLSVDFRGQNSATINFFNQAFSLDNVIIEKGPEPVPEPLTILGSITALGVGATLKREHSKRLKKSQPKAD